MLFHSQGHYANCWEQLLTEALFTTSVSPSLQINRCLYWYFTLIVQVPGSTARDRDYYAIELLNEGEFSKQS